MKKGYTLIELLVAVGIMMVATLLTLTLYAPTRKNALIAQTVSIVGQTDANIRVYYTKYRKYPDTLGDLVTAGIISKIPKVPGSDMDLFYKKGYIFTKFDTTLSQTITEYSANNADWSGRFDDNLKNSLKELTPEEQERQFYAIDKNGASTDCGYIALSAFSSSEQIEVAYRLGAPLPKADGRALSDSTQCSDRFFDIIVR